MSAQRWVILSGASRGLGLALAQQLLGAPGTTPPTRLLTLSRNPHAGLADLAQAHGHDLTQWAVDLSRSDALQSAAQGLTAWLAHTDAATTPLPRPRQVLLINNAARLAPAVPLHQCPPDDLEHTLALGLHAPMRLTAAVLAATRGWVDHGWMGDVRVLGISSGLGRRAMAAQAPYCAVKAGLDHFCRCVALEQRNLPQPARIVALAPGVIDTDMQTELRGGDPNTFPDRERFVQLQSQAQLDSPHSCAQKILRFLDSPHFGDTVVADIREDAV